MTKPPPIEVSSGNGGPNETPSVLLHATRPARIYFAFIFVVAAFAIAMLGLWLAQSRDTISDIANTVTKESIPASVEKLELSKTLEIVRAEGDRALFGDDFSVRNEAYFTLTQLIRMKEVTEDARSLAFVQAAIALVESKENISRNELSGQWSILSTAINRYSKEISAASFQSVSLQLQTIQGVLAADSSRFILVVMLIAAWHVFLLFVFYSVFVKPLRFIEKQIRHIDNEDWSKKSLVSQVREMHALQVAIQRLRTTTADNKSMQETIRREMIRAQNDADAKEDFLHSMSHEVKTPLSTITGMIHLLEKSTLDDKQRRYAQLMARSCAHLNDLVTRVLDISRLEANKLRLDQLPFTLDSMLEEVLDITQPAIVRKQLKLDVNVDPTVPPVLVGDKLRTQEILINFLSNATKHTSVGSITAGIQLVDNVGNAVRLKMWVTDTGAGLSQEDIGLLFQKFSQGSRGNFGGSGLGLSIAKKLAELMQGSVGATTMKGAGATFWAEIVLGIPDSVVPAIETTQAMATGHAPQIGVSTTLDADSIAILKDVAWYARANYAQATHTWIKHEAKLATQLGEAGTPIGDNMRAFKLQDAFELLQTSMPPTQQSTELKLPVCKPVMDGACIGCCAGADFVPSHVESASAPSWLPSHG
jgi:signal transduction histidine kinase